MHQAQAASTHHPAASAHTNGPIVMEGPRTEKQRTRCVRQLEFCSVMAMVCHRRTDFSALRLYKPSRHLKPLISHRHPPLAIPNIQRTCVSPSSPSRLRAPPASAPAPSPTGSARQVRVPLHFPVEWYTGLIGTLGCNIVAVACYAGAGATFGTVVAAPATPAVILGCNAALGSCSAICASVALLAPTP